MQSFTRVRRSLLDRTVDCKHGYPMPFFIPNVLESE